MPDPQSLTIPQYCKLVGISLPTGRAAAKRGEIPGVFKVGKRYRVPRWAVPDRPPGASDKIALLAMRLLEIEKASSANA